MGSTLNSVRSVAGTEFRRYHLQYQQTDGQYGGAMVEDTWNTRVLNYEVQNQIPGASVSSNAITLPAGTYRIRAECEGTRLGANRLRLRQTSGTPDDILIGRCAYSRETSDSVAQPAVLIGEFTSSATHTYEIQHHCSDNNEGGTAAAGFHDQFTLGPEIFADVVITQEVDATNIRAIETGKLFHVQDEKPNNTQAGTFTAGSWITRTLNTVKVNEIDGASISSNQITLPAGTYYIEAWAPAMFVNRHQARLHDVGSDTTIIVGDSNYSGSGTFNGVRTDSQVSGKITISTPTTYELQHQCANTQNNWGLGNPCNFGINEVYAVVKIWKVDA